MLYHQILQLNDLEPFDTLPEIEIISSTGTGAFIKAQLAPRPTYQGGSQKLLIVSHQEMLV